MVVSEWHYSGHWVGRGMGESNPCSRYSRTGSGAFLSRATGARLHGVLEKSVESGGDEKSTCSIKMSARCDRCASPGLLPDENARLQLFVALLCIAGS